MIRYLANLLCRSLVELALTLLCLAALSGYLAYRLSRRLVSDRPDRLEQLAYKLGRGLELAAAAGEGWRSRGDGGVGVGGGGDADDDDVAVEPGVNDWSEVVA